MERSLNSDTHGHSLRRILGATAATALALALVAQLALAGRALGGQLTVWSCTGYENHLFLAHAGPGFRTTSPTHCPMKIWASGVSRAFDKASFMTTAPRGITITGAYAPNYSIAAQGLNDGSGFRGGFVWGSGQALIYDRWTGWGGATFSSRSFGFQIVCVRSSCAHNSYLHVNSVYIAAMEKTGPSITPLGSNNLFDQRGRWVRGTWPISFRTADSSGVCVTSATINGDIMYGPSSPPNRGVWHQCPDQTWSQTIDTAYYGDGPMSLTLAAQNAAGVQSTPSTKMSVDNQTPGVSLSGPTDVSSTAGTQYITATGSAGPSGVAGIACSLDGGASSWYPGASAQIAVSGVGVHHASCYTQNNARDSNGNAATSPTETWTLRIRQPTVLSASFPNVRQSTERIAFGARTTVTGSLRTTQGRALAGQTVTIFTAPDNQLLHFQPAASVTTASDGTWRAQLPPGPSRLVESVYPGGDTTEPAVSQLLRIQVPAVVQLSISPRSVPWRGTIQISGRVLGGYIPGPHQQLLRLRIGAEGYYSTVGIPDVQPDGRFHTTFTFHSGTGVVHYWFSVSTLNEADYPYIPGSSPRVGVTVGP